MRLILNNEERIIAISNDSLNAEGIEYSGELPENWHEYKYQDESFIHDPIDNSAQLLQEAKLTAIKSVHDAQNVFLDTYKKNYPKIEIESFTSKRLEAEAWVLDNTTPTPTIDKLINPPETKQDLVNAILAKVAVLSEIEKQTVAYRNAVKVCQDLEEVAAVPLPDFISAQGEGA